MLNRPAFRGLWLSALAVHMANWMQQAAAGALMADLTPSPTMVALVQTAVSLPAVLLALPAGALADLIERRRWLLMTQGWLLGSALLTCLAVGGGWLTPALLLALTVLLGIGFALQAPASQAAVGESVPRADLPSAMALAGVAVNVSRTVGPAIAGVLISLSSGASVYAAVALCSAGVLGFLWRWRSPLRASTIPPERLWSALRTGVRFIRHSPPTRLPLVHTVLFVGCGSAAWSLLPVLARDVYGRGSAGYGLMLAALGVGGVVGAMLMPAMRRRFSTDATVAMSAAVFAAVIAVLAAELPLAVSLAALSVGGVAWLGGATSIYAAVQLSLPDWVRARGVSAYNMAYFLAMASGAALWGSLAGLLHTRGALILAAAAMVVVAAWMSRQRLPGPEARTGEEPTIDPAPAWIDGGPARVSHGDPVVVQHTYRVRADAVLPFLQAARELELSCRRNGAAFWRLHRDLQQPGVYVERYLVDSWTELQRQQERMTVADHAARARLAQYLEPGVAPVVDLLAVQGLDDLHPDDPHADD